MSNRKNYAIAALSRDYPDVDANHVYSMMRTMDVQQAVAAWRWNNRPEAQQAVTSWPDDYAWDA